MNTPEGSLRVRKDLGPVLELIQTCLKGFFRPVLTYGSQSRALPSRRLGDAEADRLSGTIVKRILTSAPIRPKPELSERNLMVIENRINRAIRRGLPISTHMLWSPKKHWMRGTDSSVDLAELAALQTLLSVHCAVREVWEAGLVFHLGVEDIEFEFMEGESDELVEACHRYVSGLRRLIEALGLSEVFRVFTTSERASDGAQMNTWRAKLAENHRALKAYWYESEACEPVLWNSLPSFHHLRRLGWKGMLPPEMRRYYLDRLRPPGDGPDRDRVDMVLRNLAGILLHHQTDLLRDAGVIEPVRFSFVPPADGAPGELLQGRVDLRFVPRRVCSLVGAAAPWSTKGHVVARERRVQLMFRGWRDIANDIWRFTEGRWSLRGVGGTAEVRADILRDPVL